MHLTLRPVLLMPPIAEAESWADRTRLLASPQLERRVRQQPISQPSAVIAPRRGGRAESKAGQPIESATPRESPELPIHLLQDYRLRLARKMSSYWSYPEMAIQKRWEGGVELGVRLGLMGDAPVIRVVRSSGYQILDEEARRALGVALQDADFLALPSQSPTEIVIVMDFRLERASP